MKKRTLFFFVIVLLFLFASGAGLIHWQAPKIEALAKSYILKISEDPDVPVAIEAENFSMHLFPPKVELTDVVLRPKKDLKERLKTVRIARIQIYPSLIDSIIGKFWINQISVEKANVDLKVKTKSKSSDTFELDLKHILPTIPISEILLKNIDPVSYTHLTLPTKA